MNEQHPQNSALWLANTFTESQLKDPTLSLRKFAKHLGVSHSLLSQIMAGQRAMTAKTALKIAKRLGLDQLETGGLLQSLGHGSPIPEAGALQGARVLDADYFHVIADWYHYGILGLAEISDNTASASWIASRLRISKQEAATALKRLVNLGFLTIDPATNRMSQISEPLTTMPDVPQPAVRKYHHQNLEHAKESLNRDPVDERYFGSVTIAIDKKNLPRAKAALRRFRDEITGLLDEGNKEQVYTLALQLFPVDSGSPTNSDDRKF